MKTAARSFFHEPPQNLNCAQAVLRAYQDAAGDNTHSVDAFKSFGGKLPFATTENSHCGGIIMTTGITATEQDAARLSEKRAALHPDCFACGPFHAHGLRLHFEVDGDGVAEAVWNPSGKFRSYPDRVHGGVIATLMDSAMVHALFAKDVVGVTAEMNRHEVGFGNPVHIFGWVEFSRRGVFCCRAEVRQDGRLAAHATAKFMRMAVSGQP